jgi:hypothetical protein
MSNLLSEEGVIKHKDIKTIAVYKPTFLDLIAIKGECEIEEGKVLSMDKVQKILVRCYRDAKEGKNADKEHSQN